MSNIIRAHIFFSGTVQGVGFRYTTQRYANDLKLKGWVRNCSDGRVEVIVEESQAAVDRLCQALEDRFGGYISDKKINFEEIKNEFSGFEILF